LKGLNYFTELFNAINNHQVLHIEYQGFKQNKVAQVVLHPWYLKQYNNRWFLFGFNEEYNSLSNLAIDRIISIAGSGKKYIINTDINFDEFFDDVVGVSVNTNGSPERIVLLVSKDVWPYLESKPIHGSQSYTQNRPWNRIDTGVTAHALCTWRHRSDEPGF
jgi:predicted DNA-binding transcriptional regulator YafY